MERGGAQDRPDEGVDAAQQHHDQHVGRFGPEGVLDVHAAVVHAEQRAGEAAERAGDDEGGPAHAPRVDADEARPHGILAHRHQSEPECRMTDHPERRHAHGHHDQREVEVADVMGQHRRQLDAGEAVVAAGDLLPLEGNAPHQHGEGERQHGEIDLRQPNAEVAHHRGHQPGQHHCRRQGEEQRPAVGGEQDGAGITADGEIGGMAERDVAGETDDDIEAQRKQGVDQDLGREIDGVAAAGQRQQRQQQHDDRRRDQVAALRHAQCPVPLNWFPAGRAGPTAGPAAPPASAGRAARPASWAPAPCRTARRSRRPARPGSCPTGSRARR